MFFFAIIVLQWSCWVSSSRGEVDRREYHIKVLSVDKVLSQIQLSTLQLLMSLFNYCFTFSIKPNMSTFFKFYNLFAKLRIIYFPSKYFNAKSVGLLQNYSKSNKIPNILFVFISYTMHCATNCCTHTLWNIWHFGRKSAKYRVISVVLSLKIY